MVSKKKPTIQFPPLAKVPGLTFRHFTDESDYEIILDLWLRNREFNAYDWYATMEDILMDQQWRKNYDPHKQLIIVELNQVPIGYLIYNWSLSNNPRTYTLIINMNVLGEYWNGPVVQLVLAYAEKQLSGMANFIPQDAPHCFELKVKQTNHIQMEFFQRNGYHPERYFITMARPTNAPLDDYPMPEGLEIRPVTSQDYRKVWDAHIEAFKDHWGFEQRGDAQYEAWINDSWFQPHLWKVAWDGDQVAGRVGNYYSQEENDAFQRKRGYTESISVGRRWRGRGLAKALIAESIHMFRGMGMEETALGVDVASPTGALNLYRGLGYQEVEGKTSIIFRKNLNGEEDDTTEDNGKTII